MSEYRWGFSLWLYSVHKVCGSQFHHASNKLCSYPIFTQIFGLHLTFGESFGKYLTLFLSFEILCFLTSLKLKNVIELGSEDLAPLLQIVPLTLFISELFLLLWLSSLGSCCSYHTFFV